MAEAKPTAGRRSSAPHVHLIEASARGYDDEVAALLRERLRGEALMLTLVAAAALATTLDYPALGLRVATLAGVAGCFLLLRSGRALSLRQLRTVDLGILAMIAVQLVTMPDILMLERARAGDAVSVVMDRYFSLGACAVFIIVYGLLIPNTLQRAALVMLPLACLPYVNFHLLALYEPLVAEAFAAPHHHVPVPLPFVGAVVGVFGAHTLYAIRRDVHKARQFGQYRLKEKLAGGGMGVVHRAEHQLLKRPCAIKLIRPGIDVDAEVLARFEQEVQVTAGLSHWNTVEIYDYGRTDDGVFYYVMELLRGMSLADLVDHYGPMPPARAVHLLRQTCAALQEAHRLGLVHRDIKPANIFAAECGGVRDVAKLLDFGLVKDSRQADDREAGLISGSPRYMSPEQAQASGRIDQRSDVYSLGATAYCLVTGQPPFSGASVDDYLNAHIRQPVVPPSRVEPSVPADLELVILRCLSKQPELRYPDAAALARALAKCACADQWSAERAEEWWAQATPSPASEAAAAPLPS